MIDRLGVSSEQTNELKAFEMCALRCYNKVQEFQSHHNATLSYLSRSWARVLNASNLAFIFGLGRIGTSEEAYDVRLERTLQATSPLRLASLPAMPVVSRHPVLCSRRCKYNGLSRSGEYSQNVSTLPIKMQYGPVIPP
jgi:hypothetical protein